MSLDYSRQPDGCKLRCVFTPQGVTFIDEPTIEAGARRASRKAMILTINDGRITVTKPSDPQAAPYRFVRDRHIQQIRVRTPRWFGLVGTTSLHIRVSELSLDLFQGLSVLELEWVARTIRFEVEKHVVKRIAEERAHA